MKKIVFMMLVIFLTNAGCSLDDVFKQPRIAVIDYELIELPGEFTKMLIECDITNMDSHSGQVSSMKYTVDIEGVTSEAMTVNTNFTMDGNATIRIKLPLTLKTATAAPLLKKLNKGEALNYKVTGNFTANTILGVQTLSLDVSGSAQLKIGIEDFFEQPYIVMDENQGFEVTAIGSPPVPIVKPNGSPVEVVIKDVVVSNKDIHSAKILNVVYTVNIEGAKSQKMTNDYSSSPVSISAVGQIGDQISLTNLPIQFAYSDLIPAIDIVGSKTNYYVAYTITGMFLAEADLGAGTNQQFYLPLNTSGTNTLFVNMFSLP